MLSSDFILQTALGAGFQLCGIARSGFVGTEAVHYEKWLADSRESTLGYLSRNLDARFDPQRLLAGARTIVVCGVNYKNRASEYSYQSDRSMRTASYALAPDYHDTIKAMLNGVLKILEGEYPGLGARCFTDATPLMEKYWAIEAGLGWRGRNSLLVTPEHGSFLLLGEILLDQQADRYNAPLDHPGCGKCRRCHEVCPAGALSDPCILDARACISRRTVEKQDEEGADDGLHGWLFGCDACQSCCPYNASTPFATDPRFLPVIDPERLDEDFWRGLTEEKFERIFSRTPMTRAGFGRISRLIKR